MTATARDRRDRLRAMLADLKMPGALEAVDGVLAQVDSGAVTAGEAIEQVLGAQIALRNNRRLQAAMRSSRLPAVKTLAQFDFTFQPSIKREQIESLHELGFLDRRENVILLGPPGVGKTHLAISLAIAAAEAGRRVYYGTLAGLIDSLTDARAAGELSTGITGRKSAPPEMYLPDVCSFQLPKVCSFRLPLTGDGAGQHRRTRAPPPGQAAGVCRKAGCHSPAQGHTRQREGRGSWCRRPRPRRCLDGAPDQVPAIGRSGG